VMTWSRTVNPSGRVYTGRIARYMQLRRSITVNISALPWMQGGHTMRNRRAVLVVVVE
jgi:hypothetical protein